MRSSRIAIYSCFPAAVRGLSASSTLMQASAMSPAAALAYNNLKGLLRQVSALAEVEGILGYDEQCFMPPGAGAARAAQKAALAKVRHSLATGDSMRAAIDGVRGRVDELPDDERLRANVRDAIKDFDQGARKSPELAEAEARLESEAFGAWQAARAASDFALFSPKLKEMFELKKEVARVTRPAVDEPYDGALDAFERGMTARRLDELFGELREGLVPLLTAITAKQRAEPDVDAPHPALVPGEVWSVHKQEALAREVAAELGYVFANGRLDVSTHPFTGGAGPTDVRITTRFSDNWADGFGATVHECGHALYEQGRDVSEEGAGLPSSAALSMGVHESQSLLWERMVLQSRAFWTYAAPKFREHFEHCKDVSDEDFYRTYNRVAPGCIRVEADEVSYSLHVILRYDIERALFCGEMQVEDVPAFWTKRMKADLGVDVPDDAQGCLQDIHWSFGAVGYFPSYTLGAVAAVQIFQAYEGEVGKEAVAEQISRGQFVPLREWLRNKVHRRGSIPGSPDALLEEVCGEPLSVKPFLAYLKHKYAELYCLDM